VSAGESLWWLFFVLWNLFIALSDWRHRKVPNTLIVLGAGLQLLWTGAALFPIQWQYPPLWPGWALSLLGFLAAFLFLPLWMRRVMGAGDIKVMAVYGLMLGPMGLLACFAVGSLIAGVHATLYWTISRWWSPPHKFQQVPYATYLALGALSVAPTWLSSH
jgi:prepilin peptidase CpaA